MSNDLISRSALIESIKKWLPSDPCGKEQSMEEVVATDLSVSMLMEIEEAPTAYDKEKVIEELTDWKNDAEKWAAKYDETGDIDNMDLWDMAARYYTNAIEIVRNGGKKE